MVQKARWMSSPPLVVDVGMFFFLYKKNEQQHQATTKKHREKKGGVEKIALGVFFLFFFCHFCFFVSPSASRRSFMVDAAGYIKGSSCIGHIVLVEITGPREFLFG